MKQAIVYGCDHRPLGTLVRKIFCRDGNLRYGILKFAYGEGHAFAPLPWEILRPDNRLGGYSTDVDHLRLLETPHCKDFDEDFEFGDDLAGQVDAFYGLEFPGFESLNDF